MNSGSGVTRWWEGYLVRYLMPSIAGVVIVLWLGSAAGEDFQKLLLMPRTLAELDAPRLILLLMYGNLFCYVASYPILTFHATRVLDWPSEHWPAHRWMNGYLWTFIIGILAFVEGLYAGSMGAFYSSFIFVGLFSGIQVCRLICGLTKKRVFQGEQSSLLYEYAFTLAKRRGLVKVVDTTREENTTEERTTHWRPDFIETYRHLREHGNSAFIFFLELSLAALVWSVIERPGWTALEQLSGVSALLALWTVPAVIVHLVGQHLERRFSRYDLRSSEDKR